LALVILPKSFCVLDRLLAQLLDGKPQWRKFTASIDRRNYELARPGRATLNHIKVLHNHQRISSHALGHVQGHNRIGKGVRVFLPLLDIAVTVELFRHRPILNRHQGGRAQQPGHTLHQLK
jgi:hypothetical protein